MKHATSRILFAYWDTLRGERASPERGEIEPGRIRHVLADTFILDTEDAAGASFRLAGTRVSALFRMGLRGRPFAWAWGGTERGEADRLVETVTGETVGVVAGLAGVNINGSEIALELLLLPLRHRGRTAARVLGALSPASLPSWAGLVALERLSTRSVRIIEPSRPSEPEPAEPSGDLVWGPGPAETPPAERRRHFVVHDGGRA